MEIRDDRDAQQFVLDIAGVRAKLEYRAHGDRLVLVHTEVPDELGGRGIGGKLVLAAVERASAEHLTVVPTCPFARKWLREHPDAHAGVTIDWPQDDADE